MRRTSFLLAAALLAACCAQAEAAFPGYGYWSIDGSGASRGAGQQASQRRRNSRPLDVIAPINPHVDYALYGRGLTRGGGSAYQNNDYHGGGGGTSYGYWDGGFNPGLYGFSRYPHFDRPGFTYWQGGN